MGYRSDVKFVLHHEDPVTFAVLLTRLRSDLMAADPDSDALTLMRMPSWNGECETYQRQPQIVLLTYDDVKWYDDYDDVKAIEAAVETWCSTGTGIKARVGEESDDTEYHIYGDDDGYLSAILQVVKSARIDCDLEPVPAS